MTNWHKRFLDLAHLYSTWSKDESTKVGAVIIQDGRQLSFGYNGPPRGIDDSTVPTTRPEKYAYFEHAERNSIYNAAYHGIPIKDSSIYIYTNPNNVFLCPDCARAIIQSGIDFVIMNKQKDIRADWTTHRDATLRLFDEAKVRLEEIDYDI